MRQIRHHLKPPDPWFSRVVCGPRRQVTTAPMSVGLRIGEILVLGYKKKLHFYGFIRNCRGFALNNHSEACRGPQAVSCSLCGPQKPLWTQPSRWSEFRGWELSKSIGFITHKWNPTDTGTCTTEVKISYFRKDKGKYSVKKLKCHTGQAFDIISVYTVMYPWLSEKVSCCKQSHAFKRKKAKLRKVNYR